MTRKTAGLRHLGLKLLVRTSAPLDYDVGPHNRDQRRRLEKELRRQGRKRQGQGDER